ncbi:hypothetical protein LCGC14_1346720, partial [marine sediment metagenome]
MSRNFGYLAAGFWRHRKVRQLDDAGRLLMCYLFSCQHGNSCGCFTLPLDYITADLRWKIEKTAKAVAVCIKADLIEYDDAFDLVRIRGWLNQNLPRNPRVAEHMIKIVDALPDSPLRAATIKAMRASDNYLIKDVIELLPGGTGKRPPK